VFELNKNNEYSEYIKQKMTLPRTDM